MRSPDPAPDYDPATACIECGTEGLDHCGCCGAPLCHKHAELGAGFCSSFSTIGGTPICAYDHDVIVGVRPDDTVVVHEWPDTDVYHLPDEPDGTAPACRPDEGEGKCRVPQWLLDGADLELCEHCADEARQRHAAEQDELAAEFQDAGGEQQ